MKNPTVIELEDDQSAIIFDKNGKAVEVYFPNSLGDDDELCDRMVEVLEFVIGKPIEIVEEDSSNNTFH